MNVGMLGFCQQRNMVEGKRSLRCNAILLCDGLLVVDVDFCKCNSTWLRVLCRQRFVGRSNGLARSTPIRVDCGMSVYAAEGLAGSLQSVITTEDEPSSLLNSAEEPIFTVRDIVEFLVVEWSC